MSIQGRFSFAHHRIRLALGVWLLWLAAAPGWAAIGILWPEALYNPKPQAGDLLLGLPCGGALVLRRVATPEHAQGYAVTGSFTTSDGTPELLIGKYEVTELQAQAIAAAAAGRACPEPKASLSHPAARDWLGAVSLAEDYSRWMETQAKGFPACENEALPCLPREHGVIARVRLPLAQEWEYAARGGWAVSAERFAMNRYFPAESLDAQAWYAANAGGRTHPIGTRAANPLGLYDLYGNVAEWAHEIDQDPVAGRANLALGGHRASAGNELAANRRWRYPLHGEDPEGRVGLRLVASVPDHLLQKNALAVRPGEARPPAIPPAPEPVIFYGKLRLIADAVGELWIDGKAAGRVTPDAPFEDEHVEVGERRLTLRIGGETILDEERTVRAERWTEIALEVAASLDRQAFDRARQADSQAGWRAYLAHCETVRCTHRAEAEQWLAGVPVAAPEMVRIKEGCYQMGSPEIEPNRDWDEHWHPVCVDSFAMGQYEVTFEQYDAFAAATGKSLPADHGWGRGKRPVMNVDWYDALAYAEWLSQKTGRRYRLPTEAEWEYAARAGTHTPFWTGDCLHTDQANYNGLYNYNDCGAETGVYRKETVPVGHLPPNPWGLHEVSGNLWEWTCSQYDQNYQGEESQCLNKNSAAARAVRGGSWSRMPWFLRSAYRHSKSPDHRSRFLGFRLAQDL